MPDKVVKLLHPVVVANAPQMNFDRVTLREPKYSDFMLLGEPEIWVPIKDSDGNGMFQTDFPVVNRYVERLADVDPNMLVRVTLADTMRLKDAVLGFFREAMMATGVLITPGANSPEASSSLSDSPPPTSPA